MNRKIVSSCALATLAVSVLLSGCTTLCAQNAKVPGIMPFGCSEASYIPKPDDATKGASNTTTPSPTAQGELVAAK